MIIVLLLVFMRFQYQRDAMFKTQYCPIHVQPMLVDQPLLMFVMFYFYFSVAETTSEGADLNKLISPRKGLVSTLRYNRPFPPTFAI